MTIGTTRAIGLLAALIALGIAGCAGLRTAPQVAPLLEDTRSPTLRRVGSAADLDRLVAASDALQDAQRRAARRHECERTNAGKSACLRRSAALDDDASALDRVVVTGSRISPSDLITHTQEAGVDEGDIVKKSGDFLLVLRAGVLHSVRTARAGRPTLEAVDAMPVAVDASGEEAWYDEILTVGDRVILLGFNYLPDNDEVAELLLFRLASDGHLRRDGRYWIRTQDYFSGDNYGARVYGDQLVLTFSLALEVQGEMPWPEWSRRDSGSTAWTPLIEVDALYFPLYTTPRPHVHVMLFCPIDRLDGPGLDCRTTGLIGDAEAVTYVSGQAAYLAMPAWDDAALVDPRFDSWREREALAPLRRTAIYRIPFGTGESPTMALVHGAMQDNPMRMHDTPDGLYVATDAGEGDASELLLTFVPASGFRSEASGATAPRARIALESDEPTVRFAGTQLLVGTHRWSLEQPWVDATRLVVQPLDGSKATTLTLPHSADRIEPGFDGVVVFGTRGAAPFSDPVRADWSVSLLANEGAPRMLSSLALSGHLSSETRSHAFNRGRLRDGTQLFVLAGWPKRRLVADGGVDSDLVSDLVYVRESPGHLSQGGVLSMQDAPAPPECETSCVDWYGNARAFFIEDRLFGLSANLLKEAVFVDGRVRPVRRVALREVPRAGIVSSSAKAAAP